MFTKGFKRDFYGFLILVWGIAILIFLVSLYD